MYYILYALQSIAASFRNNKNFLAFLAIKIFEKYELRRKKVKRISIERNKFFFRSRICLTNYIVEVTAVVVRVKPADRSRLMVNLIIESRFHEAR